MGDSNPEGDSKSVLRLSESGSEAIWVYGLIELREIIRLLFIHHFDNW